MNDHNIDELTARLVASRNIYDVESFFSPKIKNLMPDPFYFKDMRKACMHICDAILHNKKIIIFGDYDVDGATSSAMLKMFLDHLNAESTIYIPDRITEGYGPSKNAMRHFSEIGASIVVTLDCGTTAFEPIEFAKSFGLEVIVIDHHISADAMPNADAIVNPNRLDEDGQYGYLAAVGVTFIFIAGIVKLLKSEYQFDDTRLPNLMHYLDLVALGTVCDIVPLVGLNRAYVTQGLKIMSKRYNLGLSTLCDFAQIDKLPTTYELGFVIGPRINAGGRVGQSSLGARLLSTNDYAVASECAALLHQYNNERKEIEKRILAEAMLQAEEQSGNNCIMIASSGWHQGVIGIIASKVKEKFNKPTAVISLLDNGLGKASCRSIKGVDFGGIVLEAREYGLLIDGGGHAMAAGFTVDIAMLDKLRHFFNSSIRILDGGHVSEYDLSLSLSGLGMDIYEKINSISPFGNGNHEPIIKISNVFVLRAYVTNAAVICLLCSDKYNVSPSEIPRGSVRAIAFNVVNQPLGDLLMSNIPHTLDVYGYLRLNVWQQKHTIQFVILDAVAT
jgi:single-stranded-DNA-specific exonuclease